MFRQKKNEKKVLVENEVKNREIESNIQVIIPQYVSVEHSESALKLKIEKENYRDIVKNEKNIKQLNQLFVDASVLINEQGDYINNIENHVASSQRHVKQGNAQLEKAIEHQEERKFCFIL